MYNMSFKKRNKANDLIKEIRKDLFVEVDNLIALGESESSLSPDKQELVEKSERLKALGFVNSKEIKTIENRITRSADAINYFHNKYPAFMFITKEGIKKICQKYELDYGEIGYYIGDVPNDNLKYIEDFKVSEEDECYCCITYKQRLPNTPSSGLPSVVETFSRLQNVCTYIDYKKYLEIKNKLEEVSAKKETLISAIKKAPLEIMTSPKNFNTESGIELPCSIILKPMMFKEEKYYSIVTTWGLWGADERGRSRYE